MKVYARDNEFSQYAEIGIAGEMEVRQENAYPVFLIDNPLKPAAGIPVNLYLTDWKAPIQSFTPIVYQLPTKPEQDYQKLAGVLVHMLGGRVVIDAYDLVPERNLQITKYADPYQIRLETE